MATPLVDLVVVLPGITGSVLQRDGKDVWAISGQAIFSGITSLGASIGKLKLPAHDPRKSPPDDGVRADRLIRGLHGVFGLGRIDGYHELLQLVLENFEVEQGPENAPSNFLEFPYDWRHSNRESARRLKAAIDRRLHLWRTARNKDAKVILICHSMGGLISRYYLEVLQGWRDCRFLITFGTPFRGSPESVNYLANGYRKLGVQLSPVTEMMRSCPSVYELMPRYKMLKINTETHRVAESGGLPNIDPALARAALDFHHEMDAAVAKNRNDPAYSNSGYLTLPFVGVHQPTLQSATFANGTLTASNDLPAGMDKVFDGGDGTVPRISATPVEESKSFRETFLAERHSSLQNNAHLLEDLLERLKQTQAQDMESFRGEWAEAPKQVKTAISLQIDEAYLVEEPIRLFARQLGPMSPQAGIAARIERVDSPGASRTVAFSKKDDAWELKLEGLPPGSYRVTVRSTQSGPNVPSAVHERFEVVAPATAGKI